MHALDATRFESKHARSPRCSAVCCVLQWRLWIEHPPASVVDSLHRQRLIQADSVQQLALCLWARLYFTTITIDIDDEERVTTPLTGRINLRNRALFARICFSLSLFPRLKQLHVTVCAAQLLPQPMHIAFTAMAASLTYFSFDAWGRDAAGAANCILQHVPLLRRLDTLEIGPLAPAASQQRLLDLSALARIPSLQAFIYGLEACAGTHRFTPIQVAALANCPNLTSIEHACWGPLIPGEESLLPEVEEEEEEEEDNAIEIEPIDIEGVEGQLGQAFRPDTATPQLQIQLGIATLVAAQVARANGSNGRGNNNSNGIYSSSPPSLALSSSLLPCSSSPAAAAASSSSTLSSFSLPCVPTLQRLSLGGTVMSAAVWAHVSQLVGLTSLAPLCWRADMSASPSPSPGFGQDQAQAGAGGCGGAAGGGWEALGRFSSLHTLDVRPHPTEFDSCARPLASSDFFLHMLRCRSLTFLALGPELALTAGQIAAMGPALPQLESLHLRGVSLAPGSARALESLAASLRSLSLEYCSGPKEARSIQLRAELPPLPNLARLVLFDRCRLTAAEAEPLNAQLLARMPKLTKAQLVQNLLAPISIHKKIRRA